MAAPFAEIVKTEQWKKATPDERIKAADTWFQNHVQKDPRWAKTSPDEQYKLKQTFVSNYKSAVYGDQRQAELDAAGQDYLKQERAKVSARAQQSIAKTSNQIKQGFKGAEIAPRKPGIQNVIKDTTQALSKVPQAATQFATETPGNVINALKAEGVTNAKNEKAYGPILGNVVNFGESALAQGQGILRTGRNLAQGLSSLPADIANSYEGQNKYSALINLPQVPENKARPFSSGYGENIDAFAIPIGNAAKAGKVLEGAEALSTLQKVANASKPILTNAAIGGLIDPQGQGLQGRITNAGTGAAIGAGAELLGVGAGKVAKELEKKPVEVKPQVAEPYYSLGKVQDREVVMSPSILEKLSNSKRGELAKDSGFKGVMQYARDIIDNHDQAYRQQVDGKNRLLLLRQNNGNHFGVVELAPREDGRFHIVSVFKNRDASKYTKGKELLWDRGQPSGDLGVSPSFTDKSPNINLERPTAEAEAKATNSNYTNIDTNFKPSSLSSAPEGVAAIKNGDLKGNVKPVEIPALKDHLQQIDKGAPVQKDLLSAQFRQLSTKELTKQLEGLSQEALNKLGDNFGC